MKNPDIYLPHEAEIIERIQESSTIYTLRLRFTDGKRQQKFSFLPGQFNMVYLYGVGEIAISISSDPDNKDFFDHTIRSVGRVSEAIEKLSKGDRIGIRGPYGHGWPIMEAQNKNVLIITGGLGCAPVVAMINYIIERRNQFGKLKIMQGVKHSDDFIFKKRYEEWKKSPQTEVLVAADKAVSGWPWYVGRITNLIQKINVTSEDIVMMCGPEKMLEVATQQLTKKNIREQNIYLNMERNMECAVGHCGHCQFGGLFICKDGPVFALTQVKELLGVSGF